MLAIAELLLSHGADPNEITDFYNPLFQAVSLRSEYFDKRHGTLTIDDRTEIERLIQIIKLLLHWKANPNVEIAGPPGFVFLSNIPLHLAVNNNDSAVVRVLLDAGADPNLLGHNKYGPTGKALDFVHTGDTAMATLLKQYGAKL